MKATKKRKKLSKINNHLFKHRKVNYFHLHEITIWGLGNFSQVKY